MPAAKLSKKVRNRLNNVTINDSTDGDKPTKRSSGTGLRIPKQVDRSSLWELNRPSLENGFRMARMRKLVPGRLTVAIVGSTGGGGRIQLVVTCQPDSLA